MALENSKKKNHFSAKKEKVAKIAKQSSNEKRLKTLRFEPQNYFSKFTPIEKFRVTELSNKKVTPKFQSTTYIYI